MYENVIVGTPLCSPHHLFSYNLEAWEKEDKEITLFTNERYLPKVLELAIGVKAKEIRRNRPDLDIVLDKIDFFDVVYGKNKNKRHLYICVGDK